MISSKRTTANRKNANSSTGPVTKRGKGNSSRNALKHGFFARELNLSEAEKAEMQSLRRALYAEHLPKTSLQKIGLEGVVYCIWRLMLAARLEMRRLAALLDEPDGQEAKPETPESTSTTRQWFLSGRQGLRDAIRFLEFVIGDFENCGRIREDWKEPLDNGFGVGFYDLLTKWTPMSHDAILLAHHLVTHAETYGRPLPPLDREQSTEVIIDPEQAHQMVGKLLELKLQDLRGLSESWAQRASQTIDVHSPMVDFAPRYFTTACRDLHRAVDWFLHLKEKNL